MIVSKAIRGIILAFYFACLFSGNAEECAKTIYAVAAAVNLSLVANKSFKQSATGYRLQKVLWDTTLHDGWGVFEDCAHPERPWIAIRVRKNGLKITSEDHGVHHSQKELELPKFRLKIQSVVVRVGDVVHLWQASNWVQLDLSAVAEQSGKVGDTIWLQVRIDDRLKQMRGIIRGNRSVEMVR